MRDGWAGSSLASAAFWMPASAQHTLRRMLPSAEPFAGCEPKLEINEPFHRPRYIGVSKKHALIPPPFSEGIYARPSWFRRIQTCGERKPGPCTLRARPRRPKLRGCAPFSMRALRCIARIRPSAPAHIAKPANRIGALRSPRGSVSSGRAAADRCSLQRLRASSGSEERVVGDGLGAFCGGKADSRC